jgi:hypothetical protein
LLLLAYWVQSLFYKPEGRWFESQWINWIISISLILPAALCMARDLAQPITEMSTSKYLWGIERGRHLGLTTSPSTVRRLYRQCGILSISQPCKPPRPVTGIGSLLLLLLLFYCSNGSTALCFFSFYSYIQSVEHLARGSSLSQGLCLHAGQQKQDK